MNNLKPLNDNMLETTDKLTEILNDLKSERDKVDRLTEVLAIQAQQIAELQAKTTYYHIVLNNESPLSTKELAADYGKTEEWLNEKLANLKIQYKSNGKWLVYPQYAAKGYTHTSWTQAGRLFIYATLKENGILPLIECSED